MKIYKICGGVVYEENGEIVTRAEAIDEIITMISNEISKEVACNNKICTITFRKE